MNAECDTFEAIKKSATSSSCFEGFCCSELPIFKWQLGSVLMRLCLCLIVDTGGVYDFSRNLKVCPTALIKAVIMWSSDSLKRSERQTVGQSTSQTISCPMGHCWVACQSFGRPSVVVYDCKDWSTWIFTPNRPPHPDMNN